MGFGRMGLFPLDAPLTSTILACRLPPPGERKMKIRSVFLTASIHLAALFLLLAAGCAGAARAVAAPSVADPMAAAIRAAHFAEPLVATAPTTPAEDLGLSQALAAYDQRSKPDDVSSLTAFLSQYPRSGFAMAIL